MSWWWIIFLLWLAPAILVAIAMLWTVRRQAKASSDGSFSEPAMHESQMPELSDESADTRPVNAKKAAGRRRG